MLNLEFRQRKAAKKEAPFVGVKKKGSEDSLISSLNFNQNFMNFTNGFNNRNKADNNKTLIVNKVDWSNDMKNKIDQAFESPDHYFKELQDVVVSKVCFGPKFNETKGRKEVIPHSIVGPINDFNRILVSAEKKKKGKSSMSTNKNKKSSSSIMTIGSNRFGSILDTKTIRSNSNNKNYGNDQNPCKQVDDEKVQLAFKNIKERISTNQTLEKQDKSFYNINQKQPNMSFDSTSEDEIEAKEKHAASNIKTQAPACNNASGFSSIKFNKHIANKSVVLGNNLSNTEIKCHDPNLLNSNLKYDNELVKNLRKRFKKEYVRFSEQIFKNRFSINYKSNVPLDIQASIGQQSQFMRKHEENKEKLKIISNSLVRSTNKSEADLLINQVEEFKLKKTLCKYEDFKKALPDKIRESQWMATLRKPKAFQGERSSFYNTGDSRWYFVRENEPKNFEFVLPTLSANFDTEDQIDGSNELKPNKLTSAFKNRRGAISLTKSDYDKMKNTSKLQEISIYKDESTKLKEDFSRYDSVSEFSEFTRKGESVQKFVLFKKIESISELKLEGSSLLDFEAAHSKLLKGKKIIYKPSYNPETQKEFFVDEIREEMYMYDYSSIKGNENSTSKNSIFRDTGALSPNNPNSSNYSNYLKSNPEKRVIWN